MASLLLAFHASWLSCSPAQKLALVSRSNSDGACIAAGSLGACEKCISSEQCGGNMHCCPFMKTCVRSSSEQCYGAIAMCQPPCSDTVNVSSCHCQNNDFPGAWQKPSCGAAGVDQLLFKGQMIPAVPNKSAPRECNPLKNLGLCEKCTSSDQCAADLHCCPFMKTCVRSPSEKCSGPIAMCQPPCSESVNPSTCTCQNPEFPGVWQKTSCGAPQRGTNESPDAGKYVVVSNHSFARTCIPSGSLGRCEKCMNSDQCGGNMHCCPFMKACVRSSSERCYSAIAMCQPPCSESEDPYTCHCQNEDFPSMWQNTSCGSSRLYVSGSLHLAAYRRHLSYLSVLLPGALATTVAFVQCRAKRVSALHVAAREDREDDCMDDLLVVNQA